MKMQNSNDDQNLQDVQDAIDYHFNNIDLLLQAFTRRSYSAQYGGENNEVLEFLGDNILDFFVSKIIADKFGFMRSQSQYYEPDTDNDEFCIVANRNEEDFTELKQEIVCNRTLAEEIDDLGFAKFMYLGDSDLDNGVVNQEKVKADLFEAILGAIAIDSSWDAEALEKSVSVMLEIDGFFEDVDTEEERPAKFKEENAVTTLKELGERGVCSVPEYEISDELYQMDDGRMMWKCVCTVSSWGIQETAYGTSKKIAKRYAAYLTLCEHYNLPDETDSDD